MLCCLLPSTLASGKSVAVPALTFLGETFFFPSKTMRALFAPHVQSYHDWYGTAFMHFLGHSASPSNLEAYILQIWELILGFSVLNPLSFWIVCYLGV